MKIPGQLQRIHNTAIHSPIGTKPGVDVWTPEVHKAEEKPERVPLRFQRLHLRRRRSRMEPTPMYVLMPVVVCLLGFLALLLYRVLGL
jgi:hypothetical protein